MNYKNKYNKYKQKYKSLLKKIKGGINPQNFIYKALRKQILITIAYPHKIHKT